MVDMSLAANAFERGYDDAFVDNEYTNPYPTGTTAWRDYVDGYDVGCGELEAIADEEVAKAFLEAR